jgi:hypothetical protein
MGSADVGGHTVTAWAGTSAAIWQHYHARRTAIEREFAGIWGDGAALLDDGLAAIRAAEFAALRAELRDMAKLAWGPYPVPVYP